MRSLFQEISTHSLSLIQVDLGAPIYADDCFKLPAALWRCKTELDPGANTLRSCRWKDLEKFEF